MKFIVVFAAVLAAVSAFNAPARAQTSSALSAFNFGKKSAPAPAPASKDFKVNQGTANLGSYVPAGLSKEQYEKQLKAESEAKAKKAKKFTIGKQPETLTEWMEKCEKQGLVGKDMLLKGHRMVKAKDPNWYTDESPV
eukprot:gene9417-19548_t